MKRDVVVSIKPAQAVLTPFAMAGISEDLYQSSVGYQPKSRFPLTNYFLCSASIELGLKAAILSLDCSKANKEKIKKFGHDLNKTLDCFENKFDRKFFSTSERKMIDCVNEYYKNKGLEYFTLPVLSSSLRAFKDFPALENFMDLTKRVNTFIKENKYFINAQTTDGTGGGLINFY